MLYYNTIIPFNKWGKQVEFKTIGYISKQTEASIQTIRFYEKIGIISSERTENGHRRFLPETIQKICFIRNLQTLGCSLDEIGKMLNAVYAKANQKNFLKLFTKNLNKTLVESEILNKKRLIINNLLSFSLSDNNNQHLISVLESKTEFKALVKNVEKRIKQKRQRLSILHIEDSAGDSELIEHEIKKAINISIDFTRVDNKKELIGLIKESCFDIILHDFYLPDLKVEDTARILKNEKIHLPIIIVSGHLSQKSVDQSICNGVSGYALKDDLKNLIPIIERELHF